MYDFYVSMTRYCPDDRGMVSGVHIHTAEEAVKRNWVDEFGNRKWVLPPEQEKSSTFVWGFNDEAVALTFAEALRYNEVIKGRDSLTGDVIDIRHIG